MSRGHTTRNENKEAHTDWATDTRIRADLISVSVRASRPCRAYFQRSVMDDQ